MHFFRQAVSKPHGHAALDLLQCAVGIDDDAAVLRADDTDDLDASRRFVDPYFSHVGDIGAGIGANRHAHTASAGGRFRCPSELPGRGFEDSSHSRVAQIPQPELDRIDASLGRHAISASLVLSFLTISLAAQAQRGPAADPLVREGATEKIAAHTYVIPDANVGLVPNVGIVVGSRATLVIDPGLGRRNGETVLREVGKVSRNAELYVASTHFHAEHTTGYLAFPPTAKYVDSKVQEEEFAAQGMFTCGMYDYSGHWAYQVGMPAKSGVSGGVMAVVNRQVGIATYSPRLDAHGNSVRGIGVCAELAARLGLHTFDFMNFGSSFLDAVL